MRYSDADTRADGCTDGRADGCTDGYTDGCAKCSADIGANGSTNG